MRLAAIFVLLALALAGAFFYWRQPRLTDVGPRLVSNQTTQPLALVGERFSAPLAVELGAPFNRSLTATVVDARHAYLRLPDDLALPNEVDSRDVRVSLGFSHVTLTVVNDAAFVDLSALALSSDGAFAYALSPPTDTLYTVDLAGKTSVAQKVGDGPRALQTWRDARGHDWLVVAHYYTPKLWLVPLAANGEKQRQYDAPRGGAGLAIDNSRAFVAGQVDDEVWAIDLESGQLQWKRRVAPNPRALAVDGGRLAVGSLQSGEVQLLDAGDGKILASVVPGPNTPIIGGHTEKDKAYVMGGKAPRALLAALGRVFATSVGPNIGPNPDRMEVSMNSGISVINPVSGELERHVAVGFGLDEGLAWDAARHLLYAADIGEGVVRAFDATALLADDSARHALVRSVAISPPEDFPLARPAEDFGVHGRAGREVHSGPCALALSSRGDKLYALDRFTGTLAVIDAASFSLEQQIAVAPTRSQLERRRGEILYHADIGHSSMTCDACHLGGHTEGILFAKTKPLRIYRSPTVRGVRDTPPYFVPPNLASLAATASFVGDRNRYHNPDLGADEVSALSKYTALITLEPNPFVGADGAPLDTLALPDGGSGHTRAGLVLFDHHCATCHPPPLFAIDQDEATRGKLYDVGTPRVFALRPALQDRYFVGFPPPSLQGAWDVFPMLNTGSAGLRPAPDGRVLRSEHSALQEVLTTYATKAHGDLSELGANERNDLMAYVLSL